MKENKKKVLFVCLGNICRSPTAEGIFWSLLRSNNLIESVECDSAGTSAYHAGEPPDARSMAKAKERGIDISQQRSRQVLEEDFQKFDYILAMDGRNYQELLDFKPHNSLAEISLLLDYLPTREDKNVPDPYWSGPEGFDIVFDLIEESLSNFVHEKLL